MICIKCGNSQRNLGIGYRELWHCDHCEKVTSTPAIETEFPHFTEPGDGFSYYIMTSHRTLQEIQQMINSVECLFLLSGGGSTSFAVSTEDSVWDIKTATLVINKGAKIYKA